MGRERERERILRWSLADRGLPFSILAAADSIVALRRPRPATLCISIGLLPIPPEVARFEKNTYAPRCDLLGVWRYPPSSFFWPAGFAKFLTSDTCEARPGHERIRTSNGCSPNPYQYPSKATSTPKSQHGGPRRCRHRLDAPVDGAHRQVRAAAGRRRRRRWPRAEEARRRHERRDDDDK